MRLTVANVNGIMIVHADGCKDLRHRKYEHAWTIEAVSLRDVVEDSFGPQAGSFYEEADLPDDDPNNWQYFRRDFVISPCVKGLPETVDSTQQPIGRDGSKMKSISGHEIGRTDKGDGKWSATCGTCGIRLTKTPVLEATLEAKINEHVAESSAILSTLDLDLPLNAVGASESDALPGMLSGVRRATPEDVEVTRPRRGCKDSKTRGVIVSQAPLKVSSFAKDLDNIRHLASHADTEKARQYWTRYLLRAQASQN